MRAGKLLLAAALALCAACARAQGTATLLPQPLVVAAPGAGAPPAAAAFSGKWYGRWGNVLDHVLVVEKIEGGAAALVFAWGVAYEWQVVQPGYQRLSGAIGEDGVLRGTLASGAQLAYRLSADGRTLSAENTRDGRTTLATLERLDPPKPAAISFGTRAPSANSSPLPSPGDSWKYRLTQPRQSGEREYAVRVESIAQGKLTDETSVGGGPWIEREHARGAYMIPQGVSLFSPYLTAFGWAAVSFHVEERDTDACPIGTSCSITGVYRGRERITVPAGTFDTLRFEYTHTWAAYRFNGSRAVTVWYAGQAKRAVKISSRATSGQHQRIETDYDLEMTDYQLK